MNQCYSQHFRDFAEDALRIQASASVIGCTFVDTLAEQALELAEAAHRDAIQLIPPHEGRRAQYAAAELSQVRILGNRIHSQGKLQCIFMSDGLLRDVRIIGNTLSTQGQHYISLAGLLDGWIEGNIKPDGSYAPILLTPLRIGGNSGCGNVFILSFADPQYRYAPLETLMDADTLAAGVVRDQREMALYPTHRYLRNFDLTGFRQAAAALPVCTDSQAHTLALQQLALGFGQAVYVV